MAIKILTIKEAEATKKLCERFNEFFAELRGKAVNHYFCDNSGEEIPQGTECAAVVVLPNRNHPNTKHQVDMLKEYVHTSESTRKVPTYQHLDGSIVCTKCEKTVSEGCPHSH